MAMPVTIRLAGVYAFLALSTAIAAPDDVTRMERAVELRVDDGQFMGTVLVARDGTVVLSKGYGKANLEWQVANSPTTKFRLGSVTKQFTAACILLLEARGKLKTDDPVKKYIPDAPAAWEQITIFNLLTHTSGIPNFTSFPDYRSTETVATTPEKLVSRFRDKALEFAPGSSWNYSNSGYVLLGYVIEKISGESYGKFVQDNIFDPLGMKDSGYDSNTDIIDRRAQGYSPGPHGPVIAGYIDMSIPFSAGALYSTTEDLLRWEQSLYGGKVLSAASLEKMTTPFLSNYALGLGVRSAPNGDKIYSHGGGIEGFNTSLSYVPVEKLAVIVLANLNGQAADNIAADLTKIALHDTATLISDRTAVAVSTVVLDQLIGSYRVPEGAVMTVSRAGDHLHSEGYLQPVDMYPQTEKEFFSKREDIQFAFRTGRSGRAVALVLHQNDRDTTAIRISDSEGKQLADALAKRVRDQTPSPNSEAVLRRSIAEIIAGTPDYTQMGQALADIVRAQLPQLQTTFKAWGELKAIAFKGVGPLGADIYNVTFERSTVEYRISLAVDGKLIGARFQPLP
jgi:CubicO group peptidase (beta-lactamase class C family)